MMSHELGGGKRHTLVSQVEFKATTFEKIKSSAFLTLENYFPSFP